MVSAQGCRWAECRLGLVKEHSRIRPPFGNSTCFGSSTYFHSGYTVTWSSTFQEIPASLLLMLSVELWRFRVSACPRVLQGSRRTGIGAVTFSFDNNYRVQIRVIYLLHAANLAYAISRRNHASMTSRLVRFVTLQNIFGHTHCIF